MITLEQLAKQCDLTKGAISYRATKLDIFGHYVSHEGKIVLAYNDDEAESIKNYQPQKTGRKRNV